MGLVPGAADLVPEEADRNLHVDARAVTGLAVGVDRTPVPDRFQRVDPVDDNFAPGLAVDRGDQADAAGGMFVLGAIHTGYGQALCLGLAVLHPTLVDWRSGHAHHSSRSSFSDRR